MFKIVNMHLSNDLFGDPHVSKKCHTLSAALKVANQFFDKGILNRDQTCIPVRNMGGVAAFVFSADGALSLESSARKIGFSCLDIYRLTSDGGLLDMGYVFDANEGTYLGDEPLEWEPDLLDQALERLKAPTRENSHW